MAFRKFLLNGGLIVTTTIFSTDNTKYDTAFNHNLQDYVILLHYIVKIGYFLKDNILFGECGEFLYTLIIPCILECCTPCL